LTAALRADAAVRESAPAKLNLYLHVVGKRTDGYHLLDSLVAFTELGDEVTAAKAEDLSLAVSGPFAGALVQEADNLVLRSARALGQAFDRPAAAALRLEKRLPVASGIGGGSSDAAATLRALLRLWSITPSGERLAAIASKLGADVPVCLAGRVAYMGGVGEQLAPAPLLPTAGVVLVNPGIALPTAQVFAAREGAFGAPDRFDEAPRDAAALAHLLQSRRNELDGAAIGLVPLIGDVLQAIAASPGCLLARMSGSGATCFGLYSDQPAATRAAKWLGARSRGWWIAPTRLAPP
jgi:4-diphosphocytidyl-2-C-methyl-D-erythritol kinase